jgi:hypothetical protein
MLTPMHLSAIAEQGIAYYITGKPDFTLREWQSGILIWGYERNLKSFDMAKESALYKEEFKELYEATTPHEIVDAICDITVLMIQTVVKSYIANISPDDLRKDKYIAKALGFVQYSGQTLALLEYDANKCMEECLKEISSRQGSINKDTGKWIKDPNQDPSTLYKADYSLCRKKYVPNWEL